MTPDDVRLALRDVEDPELGCNIVDLGLVYALAVQDGRVVITMTMTTPGCPAAGYIEAGVRERVQSLPGVTAVDVHVVCSPPWTPDMMSAGARRELGLA